MKLRSRIRTIATSAIPMLLAGALAVGVAEFHPTTNKNQNKAEVKEDKVANIAPKETDTVMMSLDALNLSKSSIVDEDLVAKEEIKKAEKSEFDGKFLLNSSEAVNVRTAADPEAELAGKLYPGSGGDVINEGSEWTEIKSGDVTGYVATEFIVTGKKAEELVDALCPKVATVLSETVKIRKEANENAEVLGLADADDKFTVVSEENGWVAVNYSEDVTGYVSSEFVSVERIIKEAVTMEEEAARIAAEEKAKEEEEAKAKAEAEESIVTTQETVVEAEVVEEAALVVEETTVQASEPETVQGEGYGANTDEVYLLACLVQAEAGSEPYEGKLAVANVVINRVHAGYGSCISDVIYARGQFSPVSNGSLNRILASGPNGDCVQAANEALAGNNNVPNYRNFHAGTRCSSSDYAIIGTQVFY